MSEDPTRMLPNDSAILQQILSELRSLNARVQALEEQSAVRARETQPMSGRIDQLFAEVAASRAEVSQMRAENAELRAEVAAVHDEQRAARRELRDINRTLRRMNVDVARALDVQDDLEDRIVSIEDKLEMVK